jgi:hypothetical protein
MTEVISMTQPLDPRLLTGLASMQAPDQLSPFTRSLLDAVAVYFDGRLRKRNWLYPLLNARHPGVILHWETVRRPDDFNAALDKARWMLTGTLINLYAHQAIITRLQAPLVRVGVWTEFAARLDTHATELESGLAPLRAFLRFDPTLAESLRAGTLPTDEDFCEEWDFYLERHGHRAVGELDLAAPRLSETPQQVIARLFDAPRPLPPRSPLGRLLFPLGWLACRQIAERDRFMYHAAFAFQNMRRHLLDLARAAVERGQLESADAIWNMESDSIRKLDETS